MALKFSQILFIVLWLSLFFLLLHYLYSLNFRRLYLNATEEPSSISKQHHHRFHTIRLVSRKALSQRYDFTPFNRRHDHHRSEEQYDGDEIDPRYGVEKRRVPSGPNPLHH
ncbi:PREDICTED: CLAVATA3/ESR (CLE)-related protein 12 [Camelina sativa]|uniref:CLAVATA3/ESR (CLE)-related protein 12 n=1 Tax=Camelina sativa TaxID=90675 RepID=A0ABM0SSI7_CAMSA|nr:PREDICTED: CLAVATA3/ESR (CLE)-related protein 12 [Camelina sativa]